MVLRFTNINIFLFLICVTRASCYDPFPEIYNTVNLRPLPTNQKIDDSELRKPAYPAGDGEDEQEERPKLRNQDFFSGGINPPDVRFLDELEKIPNFRQLPVDTEDNLSQEEPKLRSQNFSSGGINPPDVRFLDELEEALNLKRLPDNLSQKEPKLRSQVFYIGGINPPDVRLLNELEETPNLRRLPVDTENNLSQEKYGEIKKDNTDLFEAPDKVTDPPFKSEGGLLRDSKGSRRSMDNNNVGKKSMKYIDDSFDHLQDDHYDLRGEIEPEKKKQKKKVREEKVVEFEGDQNLDKIGKPKFRVFDVEEKDVQSEPVVRIQEIDGKVNDSESVGYKNGSSINMKNSDGETEQKNRNSLSKPSSTDYDDGKMGKNKTSSVEKKASKHRKRGKKRSGKKRKGHKRNSRKSSTNEPKNSSEKWFKQRKSPGQAMIYSEKARTNNARKNAEKYKGIDRRPTFLNPQLREIKTKPEMEYLHYDTVVRSRYARTTVTGKIKNYGKARNINVNVILPHKALITKFETNVSGKNIAAVIKGKNSTSSLPNASIHGDNVGTILVETRDCDAYAVSVSVPRDATLNYTVVYEYLLERNLGIYAVPITVHNNMWIKDLMVRWKIQEDRNLRTLQTPLIHKTTALPLEGSDDPMICIINEEPGMAEIIWEPTISEQKNISRDLGDLSKRGVVGILELRYDLQHDQDPCGQVVRQGGYFAQFFAPPNQPPLTKHVVFILDASDSMQGDQIKQLKTAMYYILDTLQPMDNFTLISFSDEVNIMNINDRTRDTVYRGVGEGPDGRGKKSGKTPWPGNLDTYQATPSNIEAAKEAVKMMKLRVFTNIYDALIMGFKSVKDISALPPAQTGQPHPEPFIIFLTDGHASDGPSYDHDVILKMVEDQNHNTKATMFALGIGGEADMGLLRRFALATNGIEKHIYKDVDAADQFVTFFQSIKAPVLKDVYFKYSSKQVITATLTAQSFPMIHRGKEVIIAGKLDPTYSEKASLYVDVTALGRYAMIRCERTSERSRKSSDKNVLIKYLNATAMKHMTGNRANRGLTAGTVERIWAFLTLNQLRDGIELDHFESHQDTRCDDTLKPADRMLEISLRLNYAMPLVTNLVYNKTILERIAISPESGDQSEPTTQFDPLAAFPWILKLRDKHGFAKLPITNKKKGRMYTYLSLGVSENRPPPRSCADAVDGSPGECRYLPECPDPNVLGTPQKFRSHFCRLGSYAGVCCSESVPRSSRSN